MSSCECIEEEGCFELPVVIGECMDICSKCSNATTCDECN